MRTHERAVTLGGAGTGAAARVAVAGSAAGGLGAGTEAGATGGVLAYAAEAMMRPRMNAAVGVRITAMNFLRATEKQILTGVPKKSRILSQGVSLAMRVERDS